MLPKSFTPQLLKNLEQLKLYARKSFLGTRQGGHLSLKRGHGIEFSDYRKYEPGDDPRRIDWGVFGRSDRLYVKRYREEQNMELLLILDTSPSMTLPDQGAKWQMAKDIGLALSYITLIAQDSVSIAALGIAHTPLFHGARAFHELSNHLTALDLTSQSDSKLSFNEQVALTAARLKFPGRAILISDCLFEIETLILALHSLQAKNLDITLIQILGAGDIDPLPSYSEVLALDSEDGSEIGLRLDAQTRTEYNEALNAHTSKIKQYCHSSQIEFIEVNATLPLATIILENFTRSGLLN